MKGLQILAHCIDKYKKGKQNGIFVFARRQSGYVLGLKDRKNTGSYGSDPVFFAVFEMSVDCS